LAKTEYAFAISNRDMPEDPRAIERSLLRFEVMPSFLA
jgi:hypothetical protein